MKNSWLALILGIMLTSQISSAHCDTADGPVVAAAMKALEQDNVNYALIWVQPAYENEIIELFRLTTRVRVLNAEARELSDKFFYETLVRLHRAGEGIPYTGVLPSGTPVDSRIRAADQSINVGNLSPLEGLVSDEKLEDLRIPFNQVMALKNYDVNDVQAGREYIEAYVQFFHMAEGEEEHDTVAHHEGTTSPLNLPWVLTGILFLICLVLGISFFSIKSQVRAL